MEKPKKYDYILGPVATKITTRPTGKWKKSSPRIEHSKCTYCSLCENFCPANVIAIDKLRKEITIDCDYCKGCGICLNVCKNECIEMIGNEK